MKHIAQKLEVEVAKAVSVIMAASHAAALAALTEAFVTKEPSSKGGADGGPTRRRARRPTTPRRSASEIQTLEEQFLQAISTTPGEAMNVLAPRIGASPRQLQVVVARLKRAGKLKTVGERQFTRYFPAEVWADVTADA